MELTKEQQKQLRKLGAWRVIAEVTGESYQYVAQTVHRGVGRIPRSNA